MQTNCANPSCKCKGTDRRYCGDFCEWFHSRMIRHGGDAEDSEEILPNALDPLLTEGHEADRQLRHALKTHGHLPRLKCGCGHAPCCEYH